MLTHTCLESSQPQASFLQLKVDDKLNGHRFNTNHRSMAGSVRLSGPLSQMIARSE
jgi:hypothetical protein